MTKVTVRIVSLVLIFSLLCAGALGDVRTKKEVLNNGNVVFGDDSLQKVIEEQMWGDNVLDYMKEVQSLDLSGLDQAVTDLSALQLCTKLEALKVDCSALTSLDVLPLCTKLKELILVNVGTLSLKPLSKCAAVERLVISEAADLTGVSSMKKLKEFVGSKLDATDLTPLTKAPALSILTLSNSQVDLSVLEKCTKLTEISLTTCSETGLDKMLAGVSKTVKKLTINNITLTPEICQAIGGLKKLNELLMYTTPGLDLAAVCNAKTLTVLIIGRNEGLDFSPLNNLTVLERLWVYEVRGASFEGVNNLPKLEQIALALVECDDLSFLAAQKALKDIELGGCRPVNFAFLSEMACAKKVTRLDIIACPIEDFSFVETMPSLNIVVLMGSKVTDVTPLSKLGKLKYVFLYNNPIADYRGLQGGHYKQVVLPDTLPNGLNEYVSSLLPDTSVFMESIDVIKQYSGSIPLSLYDDTGYSAAEFFGDADPSSEALNAASSADQAAYDVVADEANTASNATGEEIAKNTVVPANKDMAYYENSDTTVCLYELSVYDSVVRLPEQIDGKTLDCLDTNIYIENGKINSFTLLIPQTVESIGRLAFCRGQYGEIPPSVSVVLLGDNPNYKIVDGGLYTKDGTTLVCYPI